MYTRKLLAVAFAGAMITASPADAATRHNFQLKNCDPYSNTWDWWVYNAEDTVEMVPYMTMNIPNGETKAGKCKGSGDGYCKVMNASLQNKQFHVQTSKTVYGDAGDLRVYDGLLDCNSEPAH